jgi:creatinine amidohydrolase/Fe(II)-dependent formamide hydrolase-like protein
MRHLHKWEAMLPEEFFAELARAPIVYWACGAMEEHGLQSALGADPYVAYEVCLRAVGISGGIVHPILPLAPAYIPGLSRAELRRREQPLYPPSLFVSRELCKIAYGELMESMADLGFRVCLAVAGHYPAGSLLKEIVQEVQGRIGEMRVWGGLPDDLIRDWLSAEFAQDELIHGHGMMYETSTVMAAYPDWVDLPRARRISASTLPSQLKGRSEESLRRIESANTELGSRALDLAAERLAGLAREMLG